MGTILGESCVGINRLQKNSSGFKSHLCVFVTLGFVVKLSKYQFYHQSSTYIIRHVIRKKKILSQYPAFHTDHSIIGN